MNQIEKIISEKPVRTLRDILNEKRRMEGNTTVSILEKVVELPKHLEIDENTNRVVFKEDSAPLLTLNSLGNKILKLMDEAIQKQGKELFFADHNKAVIMNTVSDYLFGNVGCYLFGNNSCGKSFFLDAFVIAVNLANDLGLNYESKSQQYLNSNFMVDGIHKVDYLKFYEFIQSEGNMEPLQNLRDLLVVKNMDLYIDDLGYNNRFDVNVHGTKINLVTQLVDVAYDVWKRSGRVYITSNISQKTFLETFGKGVHDRLFQACKFRGFVESEKVYRVK